MLPKQFVFHGYHYKVPVISWPTLVSWIQRGHLEIVGKAKPEDWPISTSTTSTESNLNLWAEEEVSNGWPWKLSPSGQMGYMLICRTYFMHAKQCQGPNLSLDQIQSRPFGCISHSSWMANTASLALFDSNSFILFLCLECHHVTQEIMKRRHLKIDMESERELNLKCVMDQNGCCTHTLQHASFQHFIYWHVQLKCTKSSTIFVLKVPWKCPISTV